MSSCRYYQILNRSTNPAEIRRYWGLKRTFVAFHKERCLSKIFYKILLQFKNVYFFFKLSVGDGYRYLVDSFQPVSPPATLRAALLR